MTSKRLYDSADHYTDEAFDLTGALHPLVQSLFERYIAQGYSPREIAHVMVHCVIDAEFDVMLERQGILSEGMIS